MERTIFSGVLTVVVLAAGMVSAATLDDVKAKGELTCGVSTGLVGFASLDANEVWAGFDVDFCRAVAAAVLGDPNAVKYLPLTDKTRFTALKSGEADLLSRMATWTYSHDVDLKLTFGGVSFYDGQGFMVPKELGVTSAKELDGKTICFQTDSTSGLNLAEYFRANGMAHELFPVDTAAESRRNYLDGNCEVYAAVASELAASRATFEDADNHIILPETISKEPLGPLVRHGDDQWADIVRWTLNALISAEELGITKANLAEMSNGTNNPEINRILGTEGELGAILGLSADWAKNAIAAGGNFGEMFETHIGENTAIGLARGLNAQWKNGGLIYSPPFR